MVNVRSERAMVMRVGARPRLGYDQGMSTALDDRDELADNVISDDGDDEEDDILRIVLSSQVVEDHQCRNASSCRDGSLDSTRQTVNTHASILDLTKDEEESDDDDDDDDDDDKDNSNDKDRMLEGDLNLFDDLDEIDDQDQNNEFPRSASTDDEEDQEENESDDDDRDRYQVQIDRHAGADVQVGGSPDTAYTFDPALPHDSAHKVHKARAGSLSPKSSPSSCSIHQSPSMAAAQRASSPPSPMLSSDIPPEYLVPRIHKERKPAANQDGGGILEKFSALHLPATDGFVDGLCLATDSTVPCVSRMYCGEGNTAGASSSSHENNVRNRVQLSLDITQLMGCGDSPDSAELVELWAIDAMHCTTDSSPPTQPPAPESNGQDKRMSRASIKDRMARIRRLRVEQTAHKPTRHGRTYARAQELRRVSTMDDTLTTKRSESSLYAKPAPPRPSLWSTLDESIGRGIDPVVRPFRINDTTIHENEGNARIDALRAIDEKDDCLDGYDSDPELPLFSSSPILSPSKLGDVQDEYKDDDVHFNPLAESVIPTHVATVNELKAASTEMAPRYEVTTQRYSLIGNKDGPRVDPYEKDQMIRTSVQETLNTIWTLKWHVSPENSAEFSVPIKPLLINIWIERGTVIPDTNIISEPLLMWRAAYQPRLGQHRLNASAQRPWAFRLLNTCRISSPTPRDRSKHPLARAGCSLVLRTCQGQDLFLEASSPEEQYLVCDRWKIAVARFASLAVSEDIDGIAEEFFYKSTPEVFDGGVVGNAPF